MFEDDAESNYLANENLSSQPRSLEKLSTNPCRAQKRVPRRDVIPSLYSDENQWPLSLWLEYIETTHTNMAGAHQLIWSK